MVKVKNQNRLLIQQQGMLSRLPAQLMEFHEDSKENGEPWATATSHVILASHTFAHLAPSHRNSPFLTFTFTQLGRIPEPQR